MTTAEQTCRQLLDESLAPLLAAFPGVDAIVVRRLVTDEGDLWRVLVQVPADQEVDYERCLHTFDQAWWLQQCHRSAGDLVFDYEVHDGETRGAAQAPRGNSPALAWHVESTVVLS